MAKKNGRRWDKGDGAIYPCKNRKGKVIGWLGAYDVWSESGEKKRKTVYAKTREDTKATVATLRDLVRPTCPLRDIKC